MLSRPIRTIKVVASHELFIEWIFELFKKIFGRFVSLTRDDLKISFRFLSLSHYQCLSQLLSHSVFLLQIQNIPIQNILILIYLQLFNNLNNFISLTFALLIVSWFPLRSTAFTVIIRWFSSHCIVSFGVFDITVKNFLFENVEFAFIIKFSPV